MAKKMSAKQRELRRVKQLIYRAEKRGYRWDSEFKKSLSEKSWQKLRTLTPQKLYEQATSLSERGDIITGTQRRAEERSERARKAAQTVKRRKFESTQEGKELQRQLEAETRERRLFERAREIQDAIDYKRAQQFDQGQLIYDELRRLIDTQPGKGAEYLNNMLKSEVHQYGERGVIRALSEIPTDVIYKAQQVAYYEGSAGEHHQAIKALADAIKGTVPTLVQAKTLGEIMDEITSFESPL